MGPGDLSRNGLPPAHGPGRRPRVCYVRHSYYLQVAHMHRNVEALERAGYDVSVVALRGPGEPAHERLLERAELYRLPVGHRRGGLARYIWEYSAFFLLALVKVTTLHLSSHFDVVEVDNMPDLLVFSALIPKLTGARVILYIADPMADLMVRSKGLSPRHPLVRMLAWLELVCAAFADKVIVPNAVATD